MNNEARRSALVAALQRGSVDFDGRLNDLRAYADQLRGRSDLLWLLLIQSAATHGNSRGWEGLSADHSALESISYSTLAPLKSSARKARIVGALKSGKVRMFDTKAKRLSKNVTILKKMGGVKAATQLMLSLSTRDEKITFMRQFHGIDEKYGRNVWMDIYDPSFRDSVAVDGRLKKIAKALGFSGSKYKYDHYERYFVAIAADAGIEPWAVDRLLYMYADHFLHVIRGKPDTLPCMA